MMGLSRLLVILSATAFGAYSSPADSGTNTADVNSDGFISSKEAHAVFSSLKEIEFQAGKWIITANSPGKRKEVDRACITQERTTRFITGIAFGDNEKEIRSFPDENCQFDKLQVTQKSVEIEISCKATEIGTWSNRTVRSSFSPTSFKTAQSFKSNDWQIYGLKEGGIYKKSVTISGARTGTC